MNSLVSVIIPVYNAEKYIVQAIDSVIAQTYQDWELIIVDDASIDDTYNIVNRYYKELFEGCVRKSIKLGVKLVSNETNKGVAYSRNFGLKYATGKYIAFLDADDWWHIDKLEAQVKTIICGGFDVVHTGVETVIDKDLWRRNPSLDAEYWNKLFNKEPRDYGAHLSDRDNIAWSSVMVRRDLVYRVGGFDEGLYNQNEDWAFLAKCSMYAKFCFIPDRFTYYRVHTDSYTNKAFIEEKRWDASIALGQVKDRCVVLARRNSNKLSYGDFPLSSTRKGKIKKGLVKVYRHLKRHTRARLANIYHRSQYFFPSNKNTCLDLLILHVTDRCNLSCVHCFLKGKLNSGSEMNYDDLKKLSNNMGKVNNILLTGGEPYLHRDIDLIISLFLEKTNVWINTNGFMSMRIRTIIDAVLSLCNKNTLTISVSLDGFEDTHNKVRGNPKSYIKALDTLRYLLSLRNKYKNLKVMVNTTITEHNFNECEELVQEMVKGFDLDYHNFEIVRGGLEIQGWFRRNYVEWKKLNELLLRIIKKYYPGYYFINKYKFELQYKNVIEDTNWPFPCLAGSKCVVVYPNWDLSACELRGVVCNLRDYNFDLVRTLQDANMNNEVEMIKHDKCYCTHGCWLGVSMPSYFNR